MIKSIKCEKVNWMIKEIVSNDSILDLDPIIAGSSALSLYRIISLYDSPLKWVDFKNKIEKGIPSLTIDKFNDIDMWFLEDNKIHNESDENHWIISDKEDDKSFEYLTEKNLNQKFSISKKGFSRWANTFSKNSNGRQIIDRPNLLQKSSFTYQFIKTKVKSPQSLLDSFDFVNCRVAWHNGTLYYDSKIDDAFLNLELRMHNNFAYLNGSTPTKIFNVLRAFKYSQRFGLDFSSELSNNVFNVYCESANIDYEKYKLKVFELETLYGKRLSSVDTLKSMVRKMNKCFGVFIEMKTFKPEYALYLINMSSNLYKLKDYIDNYNKREQNGS